MKKFRLDAATLEELLRLNDHPVQKDLLIHHLEGCSDCAPVGAHLVEARRAGRLPRRYSTLEADLAKSVHEAPVLWWKLARYSPRKRRGLVQDTDRFLSWGLCELLCGKSREAAPADAGAAVDLAELAVLIAERLPPGRPVEEEWLWELRALAWAHLGNARRVLGELRSAEEAFETSADRWLRGASEIGDALGFHPVILGLKASLRQAQRRFEEALALLDQAAALCLQDCRDPHLAGRVLLKKSYTFDQMGEPERSLATLREAAPLLDPERDPRLLLCLRHNLLDTLSKTSRLDEAAALLPDVAALSLEIGTELDRLRLTWAEARIAAGRGDATRAERLLADVRRGFIDRGLGYDAALVSLELAALLSREGRTQELKTLASELLPIFQSRDVHREALAALALFQQAAAQEAATVEMIQSLAEYLGRARQDPGLRWAGE
ncbi:MAG TPA: hypothetical protein VLE27_06475 [Thermoanaerobaculia bacterium]|nr:hypothetical protein [Thermoanaerobaculia bacterium]